MLRPCAFALPWLAAAPLLAQTSVDPTVAETVVAKTRSADLPAPGSWRLYGLWDNDGGVIKPNHNEDKHYTNGVVFGFDHHPHWAERVADALPSLGGGFTDDNTVSAGGYHVGQLMFTPDDIERFSVIQDDRPFAGYSFAGAHWQRGTDRTLDHLQLDLGVIGPWSQADETQALIHDWYGGDPTNGWRNQLQNEVTIQSYARRKWRVGLNPIEFGDSFRLDADFIPQAGIALGTVQRHLEGGATLRLGVNLPEDFGPGRTSDLPSFTHPVESGWSLYGFAQGMGRAVEYNHFLEGSEFRDDEPHTVDERPLVGELTFGAALTYRHDGWAASLQYSQTFLTREFEEQDAGGDFATLGVSIMASF